MDFGELKNDANLIGKVNATTEAVARIEKAIQDACDIKNYDELSAEDQVKFDSFLLYSINSLYFMHLRVSGEDATQHAIKSELERVRQL